MISYLRIAFRSIRQSPAPSIVAACTIALAVGAATVVFSVFEGMLLRSLPYAGADRLANVWISNTEFLAADDPESRQMGERFPVSYPIYRTWRESAQSPFQSLSAYETARPTLGDAENGDRVAAIYTNSELFATLGVEPVIGRSFSAQEEIRGDRLVVLTDRAWRNRFGSEPAILGRSISLDGTPHTVIGVMPPGFYFPASETELLIPFRERDRTADANTFGLQLIGRLRPGVDAGRAERVLTGLGDHVADATGVYLESVPAHVMSRQEVVVGDVDAALSILMAGVMVVLLVACANLASVFLVRTSGRGHEFAVRAALGSGTWRLAAQVMGEIGVVCLAGGGIGLWLAAVSLDPLLDLVPGGLARRDEIGINAAVAGFALTTTVLTAVLAGLLPALKAGSAAPLAALHGESTGAGTPRRKLRPQAALVVAEVAAAFTLLVSAGLIGISHVRLTTQDLGYEADRLITAMLYLPRLPNGSGQDVEVAAESVREQLLALPGVSAVGIASEGPFSGGISVSTLAVEQFGGNLIEIPGVFSAVMPDFFDAVGARILAGRDIRSVRDGGEHDVVVNRTAADRFWPGAAAIGQRLRVGHDPDEPWRTVVGVVGDMRMSSVAEAPGAQVFVPLRSGVNLHIAIRASGRPDPLLASVSAALDELRPQIRTVSTTVLQRTIDESLADSRFRTALLSGLAVLAGFLAVIGIYGVMSFTVVLRRREMGVRMALGARSSGAVRLIVARGLLLTLVGCIIGAVVAVPSGRLLHEFLYETTPADPRTFAAIAALLILVGVIAAYVPARRAAQLDPAEVLRGG